MRPAIVLPISIGVSLLIGLVFVFGWSPHPWGWNGIDQYHQLAIDLAEGRSFGTLDVPWGYAYFVSLCYRLFGVNPLAPLLIQVAFNASMPALLYVYAAKEFDRRIAAVAALLLAFFSFNTVYASTETSDSICSFLFLLMVCVFVSARRHRSWWRFAACGVLCGLAAQFRPNLILLPLFLAGGNFLQGPRNWQRVREGVAMTVLAAVMLMPWTIRNYRLTGEWIPTSTHGGVQWWYGTLQTGPYADSRAYNPRSIFEVPVFDYSSLVSVPVIVELNLNCAPGVPEAVEVVYWTGSSRDSRRIALERITGGRYQGAIPAAGQAQRIYYYINVHWPDSAGAVHSTPEGGASDPLVYFLSTNHLGDLDEDDALLDLFDLVRLLRHVAWGEPIRAAEKLDFDGNGRLDELDFRAAVRELLLPLAREGSDPDRVRTILTEPTKVSVGFDDGSAMIVPRIWDGLVTDLQIGEGVASALIPSSYRFSQPRQRARVLLEYACLGPGELALNRPFYRTELHWMYRYAALAKDNIRRDPLGYLNGVFYRAWRLFYIKGTDDRFTAQQFIGESADLSGRFSGVSGLYVAVPRWSVYRVAQRLRRLAPTRDRHLPGGDHRLVLDEHAVQHHRPATHVHVYRGQRRVDSRTAWPVGARR